MSKNWQTLINDTMKQRFAISVGGSMIFYFFIFVLWWLNYDSSKDTPVLLCVTAVYSSVKVKAKVKVKVKNSLNKVE